MDGEGTGVMSSLLSNLLLISSLLSLIIGAILGLNQVRIKRLLAYSTINHVGFLLLALSVFTNSAMSQAMDAFIFYIFQYTITNLNVFLILLAYGYISNINKKSIYNSYFKILGGLNDEINAPLHGPLKKHELEATSKRLSSLVLFDFKLFENIKRNVF